MYGDDHENTFTAEAQDDDGTKATDTADAKVTFTDVLPSIAVTKTAVPTTATVGDTVEYLYVVTNDGPIDLLSVTLTDNLLKGDALPRRQRTTPYTGAPLAPGASLYGAMQYTVVEEDLPIRS